MAALKDDVMVAELEQELRSLAKSLGKQLPFGLRYCMLLGGSFGRGEGAVVLGSNGRHVISDIDLELVVELPRPAFGAFYLHCGRDLAASVGGWAGVLGVKQVDLGIKRLGDLANGHATVASYELLTRHVVIGGSTELMAQLEAPEPAMLPPTEAGRLLMNRGLGLLLSAWALSEWVEGEGRWYDNVPVELSKAVMAIGDCYLLLAGQYHWSLQERAKRLGNLYGSDSEVCRWFVAALEFRRTGRASELERWPTRTWLLTRDFFLKHMARLESARLGVSVSNWETYGSMRKPRHSTFWRNMARVISGAKRTAMVPRLLFGQETALLSRMPSLLQGIAAEDYAKDAEAVLVGPWSEIARYLELWHPRGEAGRVARSIERRKGKRGVN